MNNVNVFQQPTPNPNAYKFSTNADILSEGAYEFVEGDHPVGHPFVDGFFQNWPVERVYLAEDFITVVKSDAKEWDEFASEVREYVQAALRGEGIQADQLPASHALSNKAVDEQLMHFFAGRILPATAQDGGGIFISDLTDGQLTLKLAGACCNCPHAPNTLEEGIAKPLAQLTGPETVRSIYVTD